MIHPSPLNAPVLTYRPNAIYMIDPPCIETTSYSPIHLVPILLSHHAILNPNPLIQLRYLLTMSLQSSCGSEALLKSIHSSRALFSSLQTQQGLTLGVASEPWGLRSAARLLGCIAVAVVLVSMRRLKRWERWEAYTLSLRRSSVLRSSLRCSCRLGFDAMAI